LQRLLQLCLEPYAFLYPDAYVVCILRVLSNIRQGLNDDWKHICAFCQKRKDNRSLRPTWNQEAPQLEFVPKLSERDAQRGSTEGVSDTPEAGRAGSTAGAAIIAAPSTHLNLSSSSWESDGIPLRGDFSVMVSGRFPVFPQNALAARCAASLSSVDDAML
jgi:hypothetical protein